MSVEYRVDECSQRVGFASFHVTCAVAAPFSHCLARVMAKLLLLAHVYSDDVTANGVCESLSELVVVC